MVLGRDRESAGKVRDYSVAASEDSIGEFVRVVVV